MTRISDIDISLLEIKFDAPRGGSGVRQVDIIVADIRDADGATGLGFSYVIGGGGAIPATIAGQLAERFLTGSSLEHPEAHWRTIEASFNRTGGGPNLIALAALDVGLWDLHAKRADVALSAAMGGNGGPVPVYGSGGFSPAMDPQEAAEIAMAHRETGFQGVKPRVNAQPADAAVMHAVRAAVGDDISVMVDANEKGDLMRATRLLAAAADSGMLFVEEPLPARDLLGYRTLADTTPVAIAAGEHLQGLDRFNMLMADRSVATIQPDLAMAGGLTPCLAVARSAVAFGTVVAPHFLPGLFVHFAGIATSGLWIEDFPLLKEAFEGWPEMTADGVMSARNIAGHGLALTAAARKARV
ncbi:MAG: mandelate racemase/muconate lactonizing enzyme family protein [Alphaproteobacteria bacterium]